MNLIQRARSKMAGLALALLGSTAIAGVAMETTYRVEARDAAGKLLWTETVKNRVTTAGLNKLLDATLKTGLTTPAWYIGLCGPTATDGVTNSDTSFSSATGTFAAGDVARTIILRGAGASGADLVTTIAARSSNTAITLTDAAASTLTNVRYLFECRAADTMASHSPWSESTAYSESVRQTFTPGAISGGSVDNSGSVAQFTINANNTLIGGLFLADNSTKGGSTGTLYGMAPFTLGFRQLNSGDTLSVTATLTAAST